MGKGDQQRYIKITKIEKIFADAWQHLVTTTFHLRLPYFFKLIELMTMDMALYTECRYTECHYAECRGEGQGRDRRELKLFHEQKKKKRH
jgi:hypothetical protein